METIKIKERQQVYIKFYSDKSNGITRTLSY